MTFKVITHRRSDQIKLPLPVLPLFRLVHDNRQERRIVTACLGSVRGRSRLTGTGGRPKIDPETRKLIRDMWNANPTWGKRRIHSELAKLGIGVSDSTVAKYRPGRRTPPSQTWRIFL